MPTPHVAQGWISLLIIALCVLSPVLGFPSGPPAAACETLSPDRVSHEAEPQSGPSPWQVDLSSFEIDGNGNYFYRPHRSYTVRLVSSVPDSTFRGVILQGRVLADDFTPAGKLNPLFDPNIKSSSCSPPGIAVVHSSAVEKTSIRATWLAPPAGTGPIRFGFAVVESRSVYWANQRSSVIHERQEGLLLPYGESVGDEVLTPGQRVASPPQEQINSTNFVFFGTQEDTIFVNTDGVLTFAAPLPGLTPAPFPLPPPTSFGDISVMIAPFWADHDNTNAGKIFYRFSDDEDLLEEVATNITNAFARHNKLEPTLLFIATWDSVPLSDGDQTMRNTYQVILVADNIEYSSDTYIMFLYKEIQENPPQLGIGFNAGDGIHGFGLLQQYPLNSALHLHSTSNVGVPGAFYFRVDQDSVMLPPTVMADISFEQPTYEVSEDIADDNLALRVCFDVAGVSSEMSVTLKTLSTTAQAGEDFYPLATDILLKPGDSHHCVGVVIIEDDLTEGEESFDVLIDGLFQSTTVTILDDDDVSFNYTGNTPLVRDDRVTFNLSFSSGVIAARCALMIGDRVETETDCSSGLANIALLRARNSEYTPRITLVGSNDFEAPVVDTSRNLRLGVRGRCSVHLINEGVTRFTYQQGTAVIIQWGLSAPGGVDPSQVRFTCSQDGGSPFSCNSPYVLFTNSVGAFTVTPSATGGCSVSVGRILLTSETVLLIR